MSARFTFCTVKQARQCSSQRSAPTEAGSGDRARSPVSVRYLAVLSAVAHRRHPDAVQAARAALLACTRLDRPRAAMYDDFVLAHLDRADFAAIKDLMLIEGYEYQSEVMRKPYQDGFEQGLEALVAVLLVRLETRFGPLSAEARERVQRADIAALSRWGAALLSAASVDELLAS
ncbi:hypothetical protein [Haliangium sp.]|uniref:hypothetical protein n=1 Tax=Haliangium sp. TaxID=2663208 RepID=UPI003D0DC3F8